MIILNRRPVASGWYDGGNALSFDGVDDYVVTNLTAGTHPDYAISFWFKANQFAATNMLCSDTAINANITTQSSTSIRVRGTTNAIYTVPTMSAGVWYHLLAAKTGTTTCKIYLNGVESSSGSQNPGNVAFKVQQLGTNQAQSIYFDGVLDEFIVENGANTYGLTEAVALYNGGNGVASDTIITGSELYYKLNESGTTTTAIATVGSNGTLTNFPASGMWVAH